MCESCGSIYAVYELEKESQIKDVVETTGNPFDLGKDFWELIQGRQEEKQGRQQTYLEILTILI